MEAIKSIAEDDPPLAILLRRMQVRFPIFAVHPMPDAYILSACRTPIGRFQGDFAPIPATDLGAIAVREAVARAGVPQAEIDEVILGHVLTSGVGQAPARQAALRAGLLPTVAALTINKVWGRG